MEPRSRCKWIARPVFQPLLRNQQSVSYQHNPPYMGRHPPNTGQSLRTLARWTNRPSSPTTSSNGQNCTRGGPAMTTFFLVACRVNMTFVYFISNSVACICVSVICLCPSRAVLSTTFRTMGRMLAVFMQTQWSSRSRSTVNLEGSCAMLRIKSSA